ncbi:MAG: hypothetical protein Kow0010_20950 [Dehalococcoidia bacterium]
MDIRDLLVDGVEQLNDWTLDALKDLSLDQINEVPGGKTVSAGFNAWHIWRTMDNIANFVFQRKQPVWLEQGYCEKMGLPKVDQGTGMSLEEAQALKINDKDLLVSYGREVGASTVDFLKNVPLETIEEMQMIKPLGEMPRWRVFRQVVMTHGFMHLGEINMYRGLKGLQFSI